MPFSWVTPLMLVILPLHTADAEGGTAPRAAAWGLRRRHREPGPPQPRQTCLQLSKPKHGGLHNHCKSLPEVTIFWHAHCTLGGLTPTKSLSHLIFASTTPPCSLPAPPHRLAVRSGPQTCQCRVTPQQRRGRRRRSTPSASGNSGRPSPTTGTLLSMAAPPPPPLPPGPRAAGPPHPSRPQPLAPAPAAPVCSNK